MKFLKWNIWGVMSTIFIGLILIPNLDIIIHLFMKPTETWLRIKEHLLFDFAMNSFTLAFFTGLLTIFIGLGLSYLISMYDFFGRNFFRWALVLPLAIPPYIGAYTYAGLLGYTGVIQTFIRNQGVQVNQKFFDLFSMPGAVFIFSMFLFPYVYITTRAYLENQSASLIENARILGSSSWGLFFRIILPITRGVTIAGVTLVILEVLNDYGVVSYLGIQTFSTAIFKSWFSLDDVDSALRLAAILLVTVFGIMLLEKYLRGRKRFSYTNTKVRPLKRIPLKTLSSVFAFMFCALFFGFGFVVPVGQLILWGTKTFETIFTSEFFAMTRNSILLAVVSASLIVFAAIIIANYARIKDHFLSRTYTKITLIGYSIPGAVVAITMILFFTDVDRSLAPLYHAINEDLPTLLLSTSLVMLVAGYFIRFLAIGFQSIEGGFEKIGTKFYEASRTLGYGPTKTFIKVDFPLLKGAIAGGIALTFVEVLKELPLALILRPFNFHTLATKTFEYANDEMIQEAAIPSLFIIAVSFVAIYIIYKVLDKVEE